MVVLQALSTERNKASKEKEKLVKTSKYESEACIKSATETTNSRDKLLTDRRIAPPRIFFLPASFQFGLFFFFFFSFCSPVRSTAKLTPARFSLFDILQIGKMHWFNGIRKTRFEERVPRFYLQGLYAVAGLFSFNTRFLSNLLFKLGSHSAGFRCWFRVLARTLSGFARLPLSSQFLLIFVFVRSFNCTVLITCTFPPFLAVPHFR